MGMLRLSISPYMLMDMVPCVSNPLLELLELKLELLLRLELLLDMELLLAELTDERLLLSLELLVITLWLLLELDWLLGVLLELDWLLGVLELLLDGLLSELLLWDVLVLVKGGSDSLLERLLLSI